LYYLIISGRNTDPSFFGILLCFWETTLLSPVTPSFVLENDIFDSSFADNAQVRAQVEHQQTNEKVTDLVLPLG